MNERETYPVGLVLLHDFSTGLADLAEQMHVWILDTTPNNAESKRIWERHPEMSWQSGVTTFKFEESESLKEICLRVLPIIEEHHDEYSAPQPYNVLNIVGISLSEDLKSNLSEFGFQKYQETKNGFKAFR